MNVFGHSLLPATARTLFGDAALCQALLAFESALAEAQAAEGLIPPQAATAIAAACARTTLDPQALAEAAHHSGALAVPLVAMLAQTLSQIPEHRGPETVPYLHFGATTQDVVDSAQVLMTRQALEHVLQPLEASITLLLHMAQAHAHTPMLARTLMQPAQVTTWGLKCAQWRQALLRSQQQLRTLAQEALVLQLGGAVGNLSALGDAGEAVARRMAHRLGLGHVRGNWHTQRDAWVRLGLEAAVLAGTISKIAKDLALLSQAEVGEVAEGSAPGDTARGSSSAMPHKRNPVACMQAIAACTQVPGLAATLLSTMAQAHERALGEWQAEFATWPQLWIQACAATSALHDALAGLQVNAERMVRNIGHTQGLVHSEALTQVLAVPLGKAAARGLVQALGPVALAEGTPLLQLLQAEPAVQALAETQRAALHAACDLRNAAAPSARLCLRLLQGEGNPSPLAPH